MSSLRGLVVAFDTVSSAASDLDYRLDTSLHFCHPVSYPRPSDAAV